MKRAFAILLVILVALPTAALGDSPVTISSFTAGYKSITDMFLETYSIEIPMVSYEVIETNAEGVSSFTLSSETLKMTGNLYADTGIIISLEASLGTNRTDHFVEIIAIIAGLSMLEDGSLLVSQVPSQLMDEFEQKEQSANYPILVTADLNGYQIAIFKESKTSAIHLSLIHQ